MPTSCHLTDFLQLKTEKLRGAIVIVDESVNDKDKFRRYIIASVNSTYKEKQATKYGPTGQD